MQTQITPKEVIERAQAIYDAKIKGKKIEQENLDKLIMIDIESGDYEIGTAEERLEIFDRLHERRPTGEFGCLRMGAKATWSLGGSL